MNPWLEDRVPDELGKGNTPDISVHKLSIPVTMRGVISQFDTVLPDQELLDTAERIVMTRDLPWKPYSSVFAQQEEAVAEHRAVQAIEAIIVETVTDDEEKDEGEAFVPQHAVELLTDKDLCDRFVSLCQL